MSHSQQTPRSARSDGHDIKQTLLRMKIGEEMDTEMVVCDFQTFRQHYLPFDPSEDEVDRALQLLHEKKLMKVKNNKYLWSSFHRPSECVEVEDVVFKPLEDISQTLQNQFEVHKNRTPKFSYRCHPNANLSSDIPGSNHRIDGSFSFIGTNDKSVVTHSVAVGAEFKKKFNNASVQDVSRNNGPLFLATELATAHRTD